MVVSPQASAEPVEESKGGGVAMKEVLRARLSWCSYRRTPSDDKDTKFGTDYPENLRAWLQSDRLNRLEAIDPRTDCADVYCCRHALNQELHETIG